MTQNQSNAAKARWADFRAKTAKARWVDFRAEQRESNHMDKLTSEDREALQWARQHRANVQTRNNVLKGIGIIIEVILLGGVLNYYMLAPIATQYLSSFIAEFGFVGFLILLNSAIVAKSFGISKDDAVVAVAAAAGVAGAAVAAAAAAMVAAAAVYMLYMVSKE